MGYKLKIQHIENIDYHCVKNGAFLKIPHYYFTFTPLKHDLKRAKYTIILFFIAIQAAFGSIVACFQQHRQNLLQILRPLRNVSVKIKKGEREELISNQARIRSAYESPTLLYIVGNMEPDFNIFTIRDRERETQLEIQRETSKTYNITLLMICNAYLQITPEKWSTKEGAGECSSTIREESEEANEAEHESPSIPVVPQRGYLVLGGDLLPATKECSEQAPRQA